MAEQSNYKEIGVSGVDLYHGRSYDEYQPELRGERGIRTYRQMRDQDAICGAMLTAIEHLLRAATFSVQPADTSQEAQDAAAFLSDVFEDFDSDYSWDDMVTEAASQFTYGWADQEVVYKRREDGNIGLKKLGIRVQETIERYILNDKNEIEALVQIPNTGEGPFTIPKDRFIHWQTTNSRGNPYGRSLLRNAYRAWYKKTNIEDIESIAVERELSGLPVIRVPNDLLVEAQKGDADAQRTLDEYRKIVRDTRLNSQAGVLLPSDPFINANEASVQYSNNRMVELELISSQGTRNIDTSAVIQRYAGDQARSILADFVLLGSDTRGSYALSQSKADLFTQSVKAHTNRFAETLNRQLVPRLWEINGFDKAVQPRVVVSQIAPVDLEVLSTYIRNLSGAGVMLDGEETQDWLLSQAGIPSDDEREPEIDSQDSEQSNAAEAD